jgi:hypothetical protein
MFSSVVGRARVAAGTLVLFAALMLAIPAAHSALPAFPKVVLYQNDFEAGAGPEWSHRLVSVTPAGNRHYLGQFSPENVTLQLAGIPAHSQISVSFDLFTLGTWDGGNLQYGPDVWRLSVVGGPVLLNTTFSNAFASEPLFTQAFPGNYPGSVVPGLTGSIERGTLGTIMHAGYGGVPDAVYHLTFTFPHTAPALTLRFLKVILDPSYGIEDESWGIDNVRVETGASAELDSDGDGVADSMDMRPASNLQPFVDTGTGPLTAVPNRRNVDGAGSTIQDLVEAIFATSPDRRTYIARIGELAQRLVTKRVITQLQMKLMILGASRTRR